MWWLLLACGDAERVEALEVELAEAHATISDLQADLEKRKRRTASLERLDAAMESAHTLVEARCTGPLPGASPTDQSYRITTAGADELLGDLDAVISQGKWIPHGSVEEPSGWRLVRTARGSLLASCGLRPADVLVEVNGVDVKSAENVASAVEDVVESRSLEMKVLRNRKALVLSVTEAR
jgi:S1-C subfamily serine protease